MESSFANVNDRELVARIEKATKDADEARAELARRRVTEPTEPIVPSTEEAPDEAADPYILGGRFSADLPGGGHIHGRFALLSHPDDDGWFAIHVDETASDEAPYDMAKVRMMAMPVEMAVRMSDVLLAKVA